MAIQGGFGVTLQIYITAAYVSIVNVLDTDFPEQSKSIEEATAHSATSGYATQVA